MISKFEPMLFGFILSGLMSFGVWNLHYENRRPRLWIPESLGRSWLVTAWLFAFPVVLLTGPAARRIVRVMVRAGRGGLGERALVRR